MQNKLIALDGDLTMQLLPTNLPGMNKPGLNHKTSKMWLDARPPIRTGSPIASVVKTEGQRLSKTDIEELSSLAHETFNSIKPTINIELEVSTIMAKHTCSKWFRPSDRLAVSNRWATDYSEEWVQGKINSYSDWKRQQVSEFRQSNEGHPHLDSLVHEFDQILTANASNFFRSNLLEVQQKLATKLFDLLKSKAN